MAADYTVAELMIVALAREVRDGDLLGQGLGTHLPTAAYYLAKRTHAPDCCVLYSSGSSLSYRSGPLGLTSIERLALTDPIRKVTYSEMVLETLPTMSFKEFSRPAQVDRFGNTNNIVIGPFESPRVRLPGAGGIPDFSAYKSHHSYLYLPRHSPIVFVDQLDFRSGVGRLTGQSDDERRRDGITGRGARRIITDLAVVDFTNQGASVSSLHPGVRADDVQAASGFPLLADSEMTTTPEPTVEELRLIREEIDPLGLRELEFVSSAQRLPLIREILALESAMSVEASR